MKLRKPFVRIWTAWIDQCLRTWLRQFTKWPKTVSSYITFCVESVVAKKTIQVSSYNKTWVMKESKIALNKKKTAYKNKSIEEINGVQKELKRIIKNGKETEK